MHLHWGPQGKGGSEHYLDHEPADIEIHLVHRNLRYGSLKEAGEHSDGLVVLGILASGSRTMRPFDMFKNINDLRVPYSSAVLTGRPQGFILRNIVGFVPNEQFVLYQGSLTTPPCSEATLWMVAKTIRKISADDVSVI